MPFLKDFIINQNTKIKLWEVHLGELDYQGLDEHDTDLIKLKKNDLAKEQFLAVRKILALENPNFKIRYDESGKPSINSNINISISHSNYMAAVVLSNTTKTGIDIELKETKIISIKDKFLNESEKINAEYESNIDYLTKIWTAKESIYKALGLKGISFLDNIIIKKLSNNRGKGHFIKGKEKYKFNLIFFPIKDYILCYAQPNN